MKKTFSDFFSVSAWICTDLLFFNYISARLRLILNMFSLCSYMCYFSIQLYSVERIWFNYVSSVNLLSRLTYFINYIRQSLTV